MYKHICKPLLDFTASLVIILITLPVTLTVWLIVYFKLGSPVLFSQVRPGRNGKPFLLYKFRTMAEKYGEDGELLPDIERITKTGLFLRKTSLDELPQFINVLKGDISLVGPRPLLTEYLPLYNEYQKKRHDVKPGITGWAQVNGRNTITWEDKFNYDVYYVENISFLFDLKILFITLGKVIRGSGIYSSNGFTMDKFKGSK